MHPTWFGPEVELVASGRLLLIVQSAMAGEMERERCSSQKLSVHGRLGGESKLVFVEHAANQVSSLTLYAVSY